nr:immunoglobulin light chain junction region [Macaca mulatta]MOW67911.1 immunoglobulin light chain junction region [Macaca mulatta]MOW70622.1 immunoglobulin light chain junction region [Macaca mulatta]
VYYCSSYAGSNTVFF